MHLDNAKRNRFAYFDYLGKDSRAKTEELLIIWQQIVEAYSGRLLTFEQDKLPAIAGIARYFSYANAKKDDVYLAGLWKSQLPGSLLWLHWLPADMTAFKPEQYRAPSWSWASLDCQYLKWLQLSSVGELRAKMLHAETVIT